DQKGHSGRSAADRAFVDKRGAGARAGEGVEILAVVEKRQILRAGTLERGNIGEQQSAGRRVAQGCPGQPSQGLERKRPGSSEEAGICHRRARGRGSDMAPISSFSPPAV